MDRRVFKSYCKKIKILIKTTSMYYQMYLQNQKYMIISNLNQWRTQVETIEENIKTLLLLVQIDCPNPMLFTL